MFHEDYARLKRHLGQHAVLYAQACTPFFSALIEQCPELTEVFGEDETRRKRKFLSMLSTVSHLKDFELLRPAIRKMGARHAAYGAKEEHYTLLSNVFLQTIAEVLGTHIDAPTLQSWRRVLATLSEEMQRAEPYQAAQQDESARSTTATLANGQMLEQVGGYDGVLAIHLSFYSKLFSHPWLGEFFYGKSQTALAKKQTAFMCACLGANDSYQGETPATAHKHMYITRDMLLEREQLLHSTLEEHALPPEHRQHWLEVDRSFWGAIEKQSVDECITTCPGQMPIVIRTRR